MSNNENQRLIQTGREGGNQPTIGMPSQKAQETDRLVNQGKKEAGR
ncbi:hypothetical protein NBH19_08630 [Rhizobium sp. S95]|uniref:Uncharacterized protein n=1 Tax=Ciceribacter sichuanensis TaxID=2949647 RepID=A0AAJ1BWU8_9HYPH|nr:MULTISPECIES: hypothetical protein [unclassified Ciceribacter]MCM2396143.1 hypothetical protein [Ciceribacter sp. S95]MCO5957706.1 hypothetical protein [Ciceribacter sp. S101]